MVNIKKIKALMGANDHTNRFLAKVLKVTPATITKKLQGKIEFKASELKKIADLYEMAIDDLMADVSV